MARYVTDLPFAGTQPPMLNNTQIKNIVYKAMPLAWQQHFIQSNHRISSVTLLELQNFMSNEKRFADSARANHGGEIEDMTGSIIKETLLLMDSKVAATKDIVKDLEEKLIMIDMYDRPGEMIPSAKSTEDIIGDNVMIIQEDSIFVPKKSL
jgi:hypothetical protein